MYEGETRVGSIKIRNYSIDLLKGFLVIGMVWAHVIQFFLKGDGYNHSLSQFINQITFPGFVFCFGYVFYISYFKKTFKEVYLKVLLTCLKTLMAFYLSGTFFRIFVDKTPFSKKMLIDILILKDMPGWSEFLAAFTVITFVSLLFFAPIKCLVEKQKMFWLVTAVLLLTTFIPYEKVTNNQLGLLIGTKNFACFPALQYAPLFLIGTYFSRYGIRFNRKYFLGALMLTGLASVNAFTKGIPERFPPSLLWIILPSFYIYLYYLVCSYLGNKERKWWPVRQVIEIGQRSLFYLLLSNIFIFTLKGMNVGKVSLGQSIFCTLVLLGIVSYLNGLGGQIQIETNVAKPKLAKSRTGETI